jgi:hypothetical protein
MESVSPPFSATASGKRPFYAGHIEQTRIRRVEEKIVKVKSVSHLFSATASEKSLLLPDSNEPGTPTKPCSTTPLARP